MQKYRQFVFYQLSSSHLFAHSFCLPLVYCVHLAFSVERNLETDTIRIFTTNFSVIYTTYLGVTALIMIVSPMSCKSSCCKRNKKSKIDDKI